MGRFSRRLGLAALGVCLGLAGAGCAPRYLEKTPASALHYPYIPVTAEELEQYRADAAARPYDPETVGSRFWIAQEAFNRSQWQAAERQFQALAAKYPHSEWAAPAAVMAARAQVKDKRPLVAFSGLDKLLAMNGMSALAISTAQALIRQIINDELELADLARVRASYPGTPWEEQALFVSGKRTLDQGNPDAAVKLFEQFLGQYPKSEFAALALDLKTKAQQLVPVNRFRIGALLPLNGVYAPFGQTIRQGLELALRHVNVTRAADEQLSLAAADTAGNTAVALQAFEELVNREKVMVIIGPALSSEARTLLPSLAKERVTLISPSAGDPDLAGASPYFFRYMLTNQQQGEAMAEYVVLRRNLQRIGIVNGEAAYDRSLAEAFEAKARKLGAEVLGRVEYTPGTTDFKTQLLSLGGVDPGLTKDLQVKERKRLEQIAETAALQYHRLLVPEAQVTPTATPVPIPVRRVAIVRFVEAGEQTQKEELGKLVTEKVSYALAAKTGLKVLTQAETFRGLRQLGMSSLTAGAGETPAIGEALGVGYVVMGKVTQTGDKGLPAPGEPLLVEYQVEIKLLRATSGEVLRQATYSFTKSIPPELNLKELEALYLPVPARDAVLIMSQLAFYDLKPQLFGCDAWLAPELFRQAGPELEGAVMATGYWINEPSARNQDFVKAFEDTYKARPTSLAVQAYDTLKLVVTALAGINGLQPQRQDFQRQLGGLRDFQGVTGKAAVDSAGEIRREAVFLKYEQRTLKPVR
jgi:ABC-type branched-subunit amino acid transport system substrate-binding protein/TolB-like protein